MTDRRLWWARLADHRQRLDTLRITALFDQDTTRTDTFAIPFGDALFDFSKHRIDRAALDELLAFAADAGLPERIEALFDGAIVNPSEKRPAMHVALRAQESSHDDQRRLPFDTARALAQDTLKRCEQLVDDVRACFDDPHGNTAGFDVIHVGIGGSELGPKLCLDALSPPRGRGPVRVHYIGNVDAHPVDRLLDRLDPARTVVCLVSKSFGTQETLANGAILKLWMTDALGATTTAERMFAITANPPRAEAFGILPSRILPIWDWVGGRYSVWSAVSFSTMLALGFDRFAAFLAGAAAMDHHFRTTPPARNIPVLMGLVGIWNRNVMALPGHCVVPYEDRLFHLPAFLQQLEMESNGKSVAPDGQRIDHVTVPILWGGVGSSTQHAFFQALHQGDLANVVEFIGTVRPEHGFDASHQALLANMLAQSAALMRGRDTGDVDPAIRAQRHCPGDRPSTTILLPALTPESLGALLAAYEHKVFVQSVLWGNNAFDQWGVELGKQMADELLPFVAGDSIADHHAAGIDASTRSLIEHIRRR